MASRSTNESMSSSDDEVDERVAAVRSAPPGQLLDPRRLPPPLPVGPVNAVNSKFVIGTKITNITVDNREKVKGNWFGLDLVSEVDRRKRVVRCGFAVCACWTLLIIVGVLIYILYAIVVIAPTLIDVGNLFGLDLVSEVDRRKRAVRCGFAVCACWTLLIIVGLLVYVLYAIVVIAPTLIDVELSFGPYLLEFARNTSRAERYACAVITTLLVVCIALGIYLACRSNGDDGREGPNAWYIDREMWLSKPTQLEGAGRLQWPAPLVVINHSAGAACYNFKDCSAEMRYIQTDYLSNRNLLDGPYNFAVGTDGRVYEFRGWNYIGAHTYGYNTCGVGIGFLGDYRTDGRQTKFTDKQKINFYKLLERGVTLGYLQSDYVIIGHRDVRVSESPGDLLYDDLQTWPHYDPTRYGDLNCTQIEINQRD